MTRIAIAMPVLGFEQDTGTIAGWLKRIGDPVERGEAIAEIETEKVTVELEAIDAGTLVEILAEAGSVVAVGEPIGWLDDGA
jgi:pyruvate dehydrogenase E2 component (dihydrolipoamide acetyltransferase)